MEFISGKQDIIGVDPAADAAFALEVTRTMAAQQEKNGTHEVSIEELADAIAGAMPVLDPIDQRVALTAYQLLAEGEPVAAEAIAGVVGIPVGRVEAALNSWPGVFRDDGGRVAGFWGLTIAPLEPEYRLQVDGKTSFAWCALDTLFIPPLMGKTVSVQATDPVTGEPVSMLVDGNGVRELTPPGAMVSMLIPDGPFGYDVIESFCHRVLFFASEESGSNWVAEHEGTSLLTVQEAYQLGRFAPERIYPDVLGGRRQ